MGMSCRLVSFVILEVIGFGIAYVVDDERYGLDVDSAGEDVGGDQNLGCAVTE